jgi:hypothetical protein
MAEEQPALDRDETHGHFPEDVGRGD